MEVSGNVLHSDRIVIATGSRPLIPSIPGLRETGYWTNREATTLTEVPESAIVLGGGPVGIELAQLLHGFGSRVTLVETADRLLAREEPRVSELLAAALREDGIEVHLGAEVESVAQHGAHKGDPHEQRADRGAAADRRRRAKAERRRHRPRARRD